MMRIKHKKSINKKIVIVGLGIVALAVGAYFWFWNPFARHASTAETATADAINYDPPTEAQKNAAAAQKDEIISQDNKGLPTGEPQQPSQDFALTVSLANQADAGQPVNLRVLVTGVSSGTCTFSFTKDGQTVVASGDIVFEATSSSCRADVPAAEFNQSGNWKLAVKATSGSKQATATDQNVSVIK